MLTEGPDMPLKQERVPIESVNFHLWQPCNMACGFCFATFRDVRRSVLPDGHLSRSEALDVVVRLAAAGFEKITFAGGEPLLCPWLADLIESAKRSQMTTNVVTNGTLLSDGFLRDVGEFLDWVTLSVDSVSSTRLIQVGRTHAGRPLSEQQYLSRCQAVTTAGMRLKINTVVNRFNQDEDLSQFILDAQPHRWKILQALPIRGQNDRRIAVMTVTAQEFWSYVERHHRVAEAGIPVVAEDNAAATGTYVMVDPAGRFIDNVDGVYGYSDPILACGVQVALAQIRLSRDRFLERGGKYNWKT